MIGCKADARIMQEVQGERLLQDEKWGQPKDVPNGTGPDAALLGWSFPDLRDSMQRAVDQARELGASTMAGVLLEEVFEALAEDDDTRLREELIQVAAVAAKWIRIIDERGIRAETLGGGEPASAGPPASEQESPGSTAPEQPTVDEREALGRVIWETSRADESTISVIGANIVAGAILAAGFRRQGPVTDAEPIAWAAYGGKTGVLRYIERNEEIVEDLRRGGYEIRPLYVEARATR